MVGIPIKLYIYQHLFILLFLLLIITSYLNFSLNLFTIYKFKTNRESRKLQIYFKLCNKGKLSF